MSVPCWDCDLQHLRWWAPALYHLLPELFLATGICVLLEKMLECLEQGLGWLLLSCIAACELFHCRGDWLGWGWE